jgi:hypothetical protein
MKTIKSTAGTASGRARATARGGILTLGINVLLTSGLGIILVLAATYLMKIPQPLQQTAISRPDDAVRIGRIVRESDDAGACRQQNYDNQTGRIVSINSCNNAVHDTGGAPVPQGTIRRLDAISHSFSNR